MEYSEFERTHRDHPVQPFRNGPYRDQGPIVRGQLSRQLSRHCSLPGSSWLSLPVPEPLEPEQSPKKPMSSSEPILDLKGDAAEAPPENQGGTVEQSSCPPRDTPGSEQPLEHTEPTPAALEDAAEPRQSPGTRQELADPGNAARPPGPEEPIPGRDTQPAVKDPSPTNSPPWPEAPEECPARPSTLDWCSSLRKLQEGQQQGTDRAAVKENGVEATPATASSEERRALQSELGKCIEEFRRIRIPAAFPNKKRQWQSELLRKYQL